MSTEPIEIFRPKNWRPARDEQWEMKQAVIARDGLAAGCFWCRQPFAEESDATLEHILPLFDGGRHDLRNCTLACYSCNMRNVPRGLVAHAEEAAVARVARAAANRAANGGGPENECEPAIAARFQAIARTRKARPMTYADASFILKDIHRQLGRQPPSGQEKHLFKAHFNRWVTNNPITKL